MERWHGRTAHLLTALALAVSIAGAAPFARGIGGVGRIGKAARADQLRTGSLGQRWRHTAAPELAAVSSQPTPPGAAA